MDQLKDDVDKFTKIYNKESNEFVKNEDQEMQDKTEGDPDKQVEEKLVSDEQSESDTNSAKHKDVDLKEDQLDELNINQINSENQISSTPIFFVSSLSSLLSSSKTNELPLSNQPMTLNNEIEKNMIANPVVDNFQFDVAHAIQCKK